MPTFTLRRPPTMVLPRAGLFATDRLRTSPATWADATLPLRVVLRPRVETPLCDVRVARPPPRRPFVRPRLLLFALFVLLLVIVPVLAARASLP